MRIPLSQLRFANKPEHVWGLQVLRRNFREQERSSWQYKPQSAPGWVQRFGELRGLKGIKPQKQLEIMPYVVAKAERYPGGKDNPYARGSDESLLFGVDGKVCITSDITLDFTINPDFGTGRGRPLLRSIFLPLNCSSGKEGPFSLKVVIFIISRSLKLLPAGGTM
jgi:hypothetical protein